MNVAGRYVRTSQRVEHGDVLLGKRLEPAGLVHADHLPAFEQSPFQPSVEPREVSGAEQDAQVHLPAERLFHRRRHDLAKQVGFPVIGHDEHVLNARREDALGADEYLPLDDADVRDHSAFVLDENGPRGIRSVPRSRRREDLDVGGKTLAQGGSDGRVLLGGERGLRYDSGRHV